MSEATPEQLAQLKTFFSNQFSKAYNDLVLLVQGLPIHDKLKSHAFMNFDQGMFWVTQGINTFNVNQPKESHHAESPKETKPSQEAPQDAVKKEEVLNENQETPSANEQVAENVDGEKCCEASQEGQAA